MPSENKLDLLRKARASLDSQELTDRNAETPRRSSGAPGSPRPKDERVLMYRGKAIRTGGGTPGAGSSSGRPAGQSRGGSGTTDAKAALERLTDLYTDGLITKAEYQQKRSKIIDAL